MRDVPVTYRGDGPRPGPPSWEAPLSSPEPAEPFGSGLLLGGRIGAGATGEVRRATVRATGEQVAVKLLRPDLAGDPVLVARFLQEADVLRRLEHPNLVRLRDVVLEGGRLGLVVDLVDGGDLRGRLQAAGRLRAAEAVTLTAQVAAALVVVHAAGITHRDVKPANVLLDADGTARLADLGVARLASSPELTRHSGVIGTPDYLAPEATVGAAGPASDVYALGVVLHELLAGAVPFAGPHPVAVLRQHMETPPPVLPVPAPLAALLAALMAKDPEDRPSAAEAERRLREVLPQVADTPALAAPPPAAVQETDSGVTHVRARPVVAAAVVEAPQRRRRATLLAAAAAVTALAVLGAGALLVLRDDDAPPRDVTLSTSRGTATPTPSVSASETPLAVATTDPAAALAPGAVGPGQAVPGPPAAGGGGVSSGGGSGSGSSGTSSGSGSVAAPAPAPAPAPAQPAPAPAPAKPAPAPAQTQTAPPPPTQPQALPSGQSGCSATARTNVNGATIETVSCISYITSSTGRRLVQADTYAREVPGSTHNSYGRLRVWVQLRIPGFFKERICEVTGDYDQPTSDSYWTRCGLAADVAGKDGVSVGFVRGENPFVQTDPGNVSQSPPLTS